jgi:hypothetical protein
VREREEKEGEKEEEGETHYVCVRACNINANLFMCVCSQGRKNYMKEGLHEGRKEGL